MEINILCSNCSVGNLIFLHETENVLFFLNWVYLLFFLFCFVFFPYMASALLWWEKYVLDGQHLRISAIRKSLLWMCTAETFLKTYLAACISLFKWEGKGKDAAWGSSLFFFFFYFVKKQTHKPINSVARMTSDWWSSLI